MKGLQNHHLGITGDTLKLKAMSGIDSRREKISEFESLDEEKAVAERCIEVLI